MPMSTTPRPYYLHRHYGRYRNQAACTWSLREAGTDRTMVKSATFRTEQEMEESIRAASTLLAAIDAGLRAVKVVKAVKAVSK